MRRLRKPPAKKAILASLVLALMALGIFGATGASAASLNARVTATSATTSAAHATRLENLLKREQLLLTNQKDRLALSNEVTAEASKWVAELKSEGKDAAALETALNAYEAAASSASGYLQTATSTLASPAGFDSTGAVVDQAQARATIKTAGRAERQFHLTIAPAAMQFRAAVLSYRAANR